MKQIWLIRHGQSKAQTGEDDDGRNPALSTLGERQASRLSGPLGDLAFDLALVSPLRRASRTYELSGVKATAAVFDSRVIESNWGDPEFYSPVLPVEPPDIAAPDRHDAWRIGAELRSAELIDELLSRDEEKICLFGHWGIFTRLFLVFCGMPAENWAFLAMMDNAAISLFEVDADQRRFIRYWNDRTHVLDLLE